MTHIEHEARIYRMGAAELEKAANHMRDIRLIYEELGCIDIGIVLTPWEQTLRLAASANREQARLLGGG